jgi:hypothetical protein
MRPSNTARGLRRSCQPSIRQSSFTTLADESAGFLNGPEKPDIQRCTPLDFDLLLGHLSVSVRRLTVRRILSLTEIQSSLKSSGAENNFCGRKWQRGKMFGTRHILDVGVNALKDCRSSNFVLAAFWE